MGSFSSLLMETIKLPTITVVTPTYNSERTLDRCLKLVRSQDYPQKKIDIILGDGGSSDRTFEIAKKYHAKVIKIPFALQHAEYNRGVAFNRAKGEFVLILDHDNFMPSKKYLMELIEPLLKHPELVASESCYYHYSKQYSLIDRYYALFGTSEPIPFYLRKADRLMQTSRRWNLQGESEDYGNYYVVKFEQDPRKFPTIGTNGCLMRRKLVMDNADTRPDHHFPIDVMFDVVKSGHRKFAFVKNSLIHLTGSSGMIPFLSRRLKFMKKYHFEDHSRRRYSVYMPGDELNLVVFIVISITIVKPLIDSIKGYLKIRDVAWFLHPIMCLGTVIVYGLVTSDKFIHKILSK